MESEREKKKLSFSYDVGAAKLRLIDMNEDDDFLIDFPFLDSVDDFRLSATFDSKNELHDQVIEPARPSYLRRSLAWDNAFFTSAGVLDTDELTFINKGLNADVDVLNRKAKRISDKRGARKTDLCAHNKMNIKRTPNQNTRSKQRSEQCNLKQISGREESRVMSINPPKSSDRLKSKDLSKTTSWGSYDLKKVNKASTTTSGNYVIEHKKPALGCTSCDLPSGYLSRHFPSSAEVRTNSSSSRDMWASASSFKSLGAHAPSKFESERTKLCASASRTFMSSVNEDSSMSISNSSSCLFPASFSDMSSSRPTSKSKQQHIEAETSVDVPAASAWTGLEYDVIQGSDLLNTSRRKSSLSVQSTKMNSPALVKTSEQMDSSSISTLSRKRSKPSALRQPLPKIGFFDEGTTTSTKGRVGLQSQFEIHSTPPSRDISSLTKTPRTLRVGIGTPENSSLKLRSSSEQTSSNFKNQTNASHSCGRLKYGIGFNLKGTSQGKWGKQRAGDNLDVKQDDQKRVKRTGKSRFGREKKDENNHQSIAFNLIVQNESNKKVSAAKEDQVIDLSRCIESIHLSCKANGEDNEDIKTPTCGRKTMAFDLQKQLASISPKATQLNISSTDLLANSRTPLADKTSICNRVGSLECSLQSSKEKVIPKSSPLSSFHVTEKENSSGL